MPRSRTVADRRDDILGPRLLRLGMRRRAQLVVQHHLRDAVAVAQIEKNQIAVVAPPVHPANQYHGSPASAARSSPHLCVRVNGLESQVSQSSYCTLRAVTATLCLCVEATQRFKTASQEQGKDSLFPLSWNHACEEDLKESGHPPKTVVTRFPGVDYFEVSTNGECIVLRPLQRSRAGEVRARLEKLGIDEHDVAAADFLGAQEQVSRHVAFDTSTEYPLTCLRVAACPGSAFTGVEVSAQPLVSRATTLELTRVSNTRSSTCPVEERRELSWRIPSLLQDH